MLPNTIKKFTCTIRQCGTTAVPSPTSSQNNQVILLFFQQILKYACKKQVVFIVPLHVVMKKFKYLTNNKTYSFTIVYRSNKTRQNQILFLLNSKIKENVTWIDFLYHCKMQVYMYLK